MVQHSGVSAGLQSSPISTDDATCWKIICRIALICVVLFGHRVLNILSRKRPGEISQIIMYNPNLKSHTTGNLNIKKLYAFVTYLIRSKFMQYDLFLYKFGLNIMI